MVPSVNVTNLMDCKEINETELREADTTRSLIIRTRKRQATFFGHEMRREKLEHLLTTKMIEGKRDGEKA